VFFIALWEIKIEFRRNNLKNSETYFKWITTQFKNETYEPAMLPTSWRVTHAYLEGRLSIYKNELQSARDQLRRAFDFCHVKYPSNQRKILKFLVPVEMNLNRFPTPKLLELHNLPEYIDISKAC
jgi:hypothetical protein